MGGVDQVALQPGAQDGVLMPDRVVAGIRDTVEVAGTLPEGFNEPFVGVLGDPRRAVAAAALGSGGQDDVAVPGGEHRMWPGAEVLDDRAQGGQVVFAAGLVRLVDGEVLGRDRLASELGSDRTDAGNEMPGAEGGVGTAFGRLFVADE